MRKSVVSEGQRTEFLNYHVMLCRHISSVLRRCVVNSITHNFVCYDLDIHDGRSED
jgi:hypothetical protein